MFSQDDARTLVGIIGNVIALILFLSPVPTFIQIWKKGSVEQYSPLPYLATLANCALWVVYGLPIVHPHSTLVITINTTGFLIEAVYLSLFLAFSPSTRARLHLIAVIVIECASIIVLVVLILTLTPTTKLRSTIIGSICIAGNTLMYASPLFVMKLVLRTKSVEYMPFFLSLFSFLNGICWTTYALIRFDPFIVVPNGMGTVLGLAQLVLYAAFYKSTKRIIAQRKAQEELGLPVKVSKADSILIDQI